MSEHPDCALVRQGYTAFVSGDMETLGTLMTADAVYHVPGHNPLSGHHKGREAILDLFRRMGEETDGTMQIQLEAVLADGRGHVMSFHTSRADRGDRGIEIREGLFFTIVGGKVTDIDECTEDLDEMDAFWS
ncbi:nuclear transport factor 2 family protein [Streptomyces sp. Tu 2975]|uniref:nuclear transport factor 2 family protein n=1 Tax=Streptomyces sp. Tu 2975 TaxID=2676871 RepID=UPI001358F2EB|nr:nuclear transport factor 2 family protein [Streptomyces sp. Tu 2975]QIP87336.1 nuclear transport factor 2 family protein [Streptomyces sp. Tu 2975]